MKKILLMVAAAMMGVTVMSAEGMSKNHAVYVELFGPSNMIGVAYDGRIPTDPHFGYRAGLSYQSLMFDSSFGDLNSKTYAIAVPIEANYLVGNMKNNLEIGLGADLGFYHESFKMSDDKTVSNSFGYYFYGNLGYRLVTNCGFQLRVGLTAPFNFGGRDAIGFDYAVFPYLSFGYAF